MAGPSRISVVSVLSLFYVAFVEDGSAKAKFRYEGRSSGDTGTGFYGTTPRPVPGVPRRRRESRARDVDVRVPSLQSNLLVNVGR